MDFCDKIATLCIEKYNTLAKCGKPLENKEWTHLSAIVQEVDGKIEVVSLATGTKCIGASCMSSDGSVVNDSHAEVLTRRAFLRYLYDQIKIAKSRDTTSIFKAEDMKFICHKNMKWHMFTSQVPCGDASILPMVDLPNECEPLAKRQKVDIHRTGAKPLSSDSRQDKKEPGNAYHTTGAVRIKPGRGCPTLSLSCSDKIAKWIHVGLQGALLTHLIQGRIFLSTIIIGGGGPFNSEIIFESLINRAKTKNNIPKILQSNIKLNSLYTGSNLGKPAPASIIWCNVDDRPLEVSVEGKPLGATKKSTRVLKICKKELFNEFSTALKHCLTYREMKDKAEAYQTECQKFKTNMGSWSQKPSLESFYASK